MNKSLQKLPCVILCGGKSSRMGEDKALLPFDKYNTLVQYQVERLKPYFKSVQLSSKTNKFDFPCDIIYDAEEISSPMIALKTILNALKDEKVFIMTVDTPFVSLGTMDKLYASSKNFDITVAQTLRTHNLCGVFSKSILANVVEMVDDDFHKIGALLKNVNTSYVKFDDENEFLNLNTQNEYKLAMELI
ncbi:molybdenum cofactor guanylyltransferase [Arcobacter sp. 31_11_sub10_T18]|nr:molybdenum cofactor guanylyltransferase [Arcobacter sp. 31_11_sub10_T18]